MLRYCNYLQLHSTVHCTCSRLVSVSECANNRDQYATPNTVTTQFNLAFGSFFFSIGHRTTTALSLAISQNVECPMCSPVPFLCTIAAVTVGRKEKNSAMTRRATIKLQERHTNIFKGFVCIYQSAGYLRAYGIDPSLHLRLGKGFVLQYCFYSL